MLIGNNWLIDQNEQLANINILVLPVMLHNSVLNFWSLMRQQLQTADVWCICKLIAVVTDFRYSDKIPYQSSVYPSYNLKLYSHLCDVEYIWQSIKTVHNDILL